MEQLKRRGFLMMLAATGAAAVCGLKAGEAIAQPEAGDAAKAAAGAGADAVTETTEAGLEPNQYYIRRRWRRRRVVYFRPRRRRVVYLYRRRPRRVYFYRRPRRVVRFYRVRRVRRWRRW